MFDDFFSVNCAHFSDFWDHLSLNSPFSNIFRWAFLGFSQKFEKFHVKAAAVVFRPVSFILRQENPRFDISELIIFNIWYFEKKILLNVRWYLVFIVVQRLDSFCSARREVILLGVQYGYPAVETAKVRCLTPGPRDSPAVLRTGYPRRPWKSLDS